MGLCHKPIHASRSKISIKDFNNLPCNYKRQKFKEELIMAENQQNSKSFFDASRQFTSGEELITISDTADSTQTTIKETPKAARTFGKIINKPTPTDNKKKPDDNKEELEKIKQQAQAELNKLAGEIKKCNASIASEEYKIGQCLIRAKEIAGSHGMWGNFLKQVSINERKAQRLMQLVREYPNTTAVTHLGVTKSLALLAIPEAERSAFIAKPHNVQNSKGEVIQKSVADMSVRDLNEVLGNRKNPNSTDTKPSATADGQTKSINIPLSQYNELFRNKKPDDIVTEIIEAVKFYRKNNKNKT